MRKGYRKPGLRHAKCYQEKHNIMLSSPKIQQYVRSIEYNKRSLNLMNTTILRNNIENKRMGRNTFYEL